MKPLEVATCAAGVQVHLQIGFSHDILSGMKLSAGGGDYKIFPMGGSQVILKGCRCRVGSYYTEVL